MTERTLQILIIDDDEIGREHVRRTLRNVSRSIHIDEADSLASGLETLAEGRYDCALLDYHLGDGTGFDLLEAIPERVPDFDTPVIFLTGAGNEDVAVKALKAGALVYLNKDQATAHELEQAIRAAIAESRLARAESDYRSELERHSFYDDLTGLPNRRLFLDRLEQRISSAEREGEHFAVLNIDLDMFKAVNDNLGHDAGDEVLRVIGARLLRLARRSDTYGRMGGDEFAVLLSSTQDVSGAVTVSSKIADAVAEPIRIGTEIVNVGASIGIAGYPEHGRSAAELIRHADQAMYEAKRSAKSFSVFHGADDALLHESARLSSEIAALAEPHNLLIHYQPKYELSSMRLAGVEALARWRHPMLGIVPPDKFINIVERSKFVEQFTWAVLGKVMRHAVEWREAGFEFPVAVNISSRALYDEHFVDKLLEKLHAHALSPDALILEVTETASFNQYDKPASVLGACVDAGIGIAIDDFGTGYTSFRYLREFPATELKIDRLFIASMAVNERDRSIVSSMVRLAQGIGAATVAEGIESRATLDALIELGCEFGQGFYLSTPLPVERLDITGASQRSPRVTAASAG